MSRRAGFTFVEILVAMLVFSALTAMGVPRYRGYKQRAYLATLRTDLGQIRIAEEANWAEHQAYTTNLASLDWKSTSDVTVTLASSDPNKGFSATATHALAPGLECATFVGSEAVSTPSGAIACGPVPTSGVGTGTGPTP